MSPLQTISKSEYDRWREEGECLETKYGFPAVILHPDDTVTKFWARPHRLFSSSRWRPYSTRFVKNAARLHELGIQAPEILLHARLEGTHVRLVRYRSLAGTSIREILQTEPLMINVPQLAKFYAHLHDLGIAFRSGHLGNIILTPEQSYGLIDFSNLQLSRHPLTLTQRGKNMANPLRYREDIEAMTAAGLPDLLQAYCDAANLSDSDAQIFTTFATSH